jgi:hypothetical protein
LTGWGGLGWIHLWQWEVCGFCVGIIPLGMLEMASAQRNNESYVWAKNLSDTSSQLIGNVAILFGGT